MKRILAVLLCLMMLLAGCSKEPPVETNVPTTLAPTTEPTVPPTTTEPVVTEPVETEPPAPNSDPAYALTDHVVVIRAFLERGAVVEIVGEYDDTYYVVKTEDGYGLIEKLVVRLEGQEPYAQWTGYARGSSKFYANYRMSADNVRDLGMNTNVVVLEELGDICLVQLGSDLGYMLLSQISRTPIVYVPGNSSADGGDISLGAVGGVNRLSNFVPQEGEVTGTGTVLIQDAELVVGWYDRGEQMQVVSSVDFAPYVENYVVVYENGQWGYVSLFLVANADAEPFVEWTGYARGNAPFYTNYHLSGEPAQKLAVNTVIRVLADLENCYLVDVGGTLGYMPKEQISATKIVISNQGGEWSDPVL